ncbi:protein mono-ADP-ribosyltransferase PARP15-like [Centrocercus urophasianus]|uniref:protein mono-ADP-ribosyltransferase PARP15-like n=1 Tax=Centrocercus urophasianus TaxID=9002 RepID=UPI001C64E2DA|nr:protein mono-ADP-ribosyltransferase PARP15-like [Centrocercus urophasianus]
MQNQQLKIVELKPDAKDYKQAKERFLKTAPSLNLKIEKIERAQNPSLWKVYGIKKCQMDDKNSDNSNEKFPSGGASTESLTFISNCGFNRSYAGMHAALYENGTLLFTPAILLMTSTQNQMRTRSGFTCTRRRSGDTDLLDTSSHVILVQRKCTRTVAKDIVEMMTE